MPGQKTISMILILKYGLTVVDIILNLSLSHHDIRLGKEKDCVFYVKFDRSNCVFLFF